MASSICRDLILINHAFHPLRCQLGILSLTNLIELVDVERDRDISDCFQVDFLSDLLRRPFRLEFLEALDLSHLGKVGIHLD